MDDMFFFVVVLAVFALDQQLIYFYRLFLSPSCRKKKIKEIRKRAVWKKRGKEKESCTGNMKRKLQGRVRLLFMLPSFYSACSVLPWIASRTPKQPLRLSRYTDKISHGNSKNLATWGVGASSLSQIGLS